MAMLGVLLAVLLPPPPALAATESEGYLALPDGTRLRYTVLLPDGDGPFPTVLQYSGYNNGNNPYDGTFGKAVDQALERGIAVIGVNLRGSGCSEGTYTPFGNEWAEDGVHVLDWIADQPWSDGNVAMAGVSYPAIVALVTAVEQPEHLRAVIANVPVIDLYPDVAYPGGIFNQTFASAWTLLQKYGTFFGLQEIAEGDLDCLQSIPTQNDPTDITGVQAASNPYKDSFDRYTDFLQPEDLARIQAPTLVYTAWQDEQLGSRAMHAYEHLDPAHRWIVASNGDHIGFAGSAWHREFMVDFLDHFLRGGTPDDFDAPMVQLARDVRREDAGFDEMTTFDTYPVPTATVRLYAQPDQSLALDAPTEAAELSFGAPLPAPSVFVGIDANVGFNPEVYSETYKLPVVPGGSVALTTPALAEDVEVYGPGSVDLWLSSTNTDADLQVTLTEVRPDGQETYVQRGWLRASHRHLDETASTPSRPVPTHLEADVAPLPDEPTLVRVEMWPVHHVFRAGSAVRLSIESPVGFTGFRQLQFDPTPAQHTIHIGPDMPTSYVLGHLPDPVVDSDLPACDSLRNQPCRTASGTVPAGSLTLPGAPSGEGGGGTGPTPAPDPAPTTPDTPDGGRPLPAPGGGAALLALGLVTAATTTARRR